MQARAPLLLALVACGGSPSTPDARIAIDAAVPVFPATITLPATSGAIDNPFDATVTGTSGAAIGAVALTDNAGALGLTGTTTAFVYERQPFGAYTLFQGFALGAARWDVFWAYCMGGALVTVYDEGVGDPRLFQETATGSCAIAATATASPIALPAIAVPAPTPLAGYTVSGPAIDVQHDGTGSLLVDGARWPLIVFGDVDCSTVCGSPGWRELHTVFWDERGQRAIVAIVYLEANQPGQVLITYGRALPDLADPVGTRTLTATWTIPTARARTPRGPFVGMPPPGHAPPTALRP